MVQEGPCYAEVTTPNWKLDAVKKCAVDGCPRPYEARGYCATHYMRVRRHGDASITLCAPNGMGRFLTSNGYVRIKRPGHPVATVGGNAYEHRVVLWDKIGSGQHACHWCGTMVDWFVEPLLQTDHLNQQRGDNRPENLVPSCGKCNGGRNAETAKAGFRAFLNDPIRRAPWFAALHARRRRIQRDCEWCRSPFETTPRGRKRFCDHRCAAFARERARSARSIPVAGQHR
jgi:hypothetical protein